MGQQGFTLIEQLVTVAKMAMVLIAGIAALSTGALGLSVTQSRNHAMNLAQERMECIKALPFNPQGMPFDAQHYSDECPVGSSSGYDVTIDVVSGADLPAQFGGSDKIRLIKVNVSRGSNSILEMEGLKVNRQ